MTKFTFDLKKYLENIELRIIKRALVKNHNCRKDAAYSLGLQRSTLVMKMKKYGILDTTPQPQHWMHRG